MIYKYLNIFYCELDFQNDSAMSYAQNSSKVSTGYFKSPLLAISLNAFLEKLKVLKLWSLDLLLHKAYQF